MGDNGNGTLPAVPVKNGNGSPANGNYVVGYGKPPIATRFQPGNRANPGGMPKGTKPARRRLRRALVKMIQEDPSRADAIVRGLVNACIEGDAACQRIAWDRLDGVLEKKIDIRARAIAKVIVRGE